MVLVLILVTGLWWMFLISPKNSAIADAETQLSDAETQEVLLRTQLKSLQEIKDSEVGFIVAIGEMERGMPVRPELASFIDDLTLLAGRTGVDLDTISPSAPAEIVDSGYYEMPVGLLLQGEFFEVLGFLYGLESMDRLVRVDGISLGRIEVAVADATDTTDEAATDTTAPTDDEAKDRPTVGMLNVSIVTTLFTRSPVAVPVAPTEEEAGE
jgi:Tfp pilus assembly protein PilO